MRYKVTVQARKSGEAEWKTRNTLPEDGPLDTTVLQANKLMESWRSNYQDGTELRVHVKKLGN